MAGYYGKLPSKGDFVARDLSQQVVDSIHEFFAEGLKCAKDMLGEDWITKYSVCPIWQFYLQENIVDERAWVGTWVPSVDRVDRHFPFIVMQPVSPLHSLSEMAQFKDDLLLLEDKLVELLQPSSQLDDHAQELTIAATQLRHQDQFTIIELLGSVDNPLEFIPEATTELERYLVNEVLQLKQQVDSLNKKLFEVTCVDETVDLPPDLTAVSLQFGKNMAAKAQDIEVVAGNDPDAQQSFWLTAGTETVPPQLVAFNKLPAADVFYQFLVGFENV